jgi:flagellar biosynthetic protein FliQ
MIDAQLVELVRQALLTGLVVAAPVLIAGFLTGTLLGLVQAATGVHEPIVGLVPRLLVMAVMILLCLPWIVERFVELFRTAAGVA